jgi:hypothetical protein
VEPLRAASHSRMDASWTKAIGGLNHGKTVRLNVAPKERVGRYAPESGPIMLTLSFVVLDP